MIHSGNLTPVVIYPRKIHLQDINVIILVRPAPVALAADAMISADVCDHPPLPVQSGGTSGFGWVDLPALELFVICAAQNDVIEFKVCSSKGEQCKE